MCGDLGRVPYKGHIRRVMVEDLWLVGDSGRRQRSAHLSAGARIVHLEFAS